MRIPLLAQSCCHVIHCQCMILIFYLETEILNLRASLSMQLRTRLIEENWGFDVAVNA